MTFIVHLIRWIFLILLQIFVLNYFEFGSYVHPYLYVASILLLPLEISGFWLLTIAFFTGFLIDISTSTLGCHLISTVLMAFLRYKIQPLLAPGNDGYEIHHRPTVRSLGFKWFISYSSILILTHHICLFSLEAFHTALLQNALLVALSSAAATILFCVIYQFFLIPHK